MTDAAVPNSQSVVPGAYTVAESAVTGWDPNPNGAVNDIAGIINERDLPNRVFSARSIWRLLTHS